MGTSTRNLDKGNHLKKGIEDKDANIQDFKT